MCSSVSAGCENKCPHPTPRPLPVFLRLVRGSGTRVMEPPQLGTNFNIHHGFTKVAAFSSMGLAGDWVGKTIGRSSTGVEPYGPSDSPPCLPQTALSSCIAFDALLTELWVTDGTGKTRDATEGCGDSVSTYSPFVLPLIIRLKNLVCSPIQTTRSSTQLLIGTRSIENHPTESTTAISCSSWFLSQP